MPSVSIPDLLKAAERPLALFLEDALRHVEPNYWDRVVKAFISTANIATGYREYQGSERLRDSRGRDKTSLTQCDMQFLTSLFLFSVKRPHKSADPSLFYPRLKEHLPFTQANDEISTKIAAVRELRNEWAHEQVHDYDDHDVDVARAKLLDLYKRELLTCIRVSPMLFRPETKDSIEAFVNRLIQGETQAEVISVPESISADTPPAIEIEVDEASTAAPTPSPIPAATVEAGTSVEANNRADRPASVQIKRWIPIAAAFLIVSTLLASFLMRGDGEEAGVVDSDASVATPIADAPPVRTVHVLAPQKVCDPSMFTAWNTLALEQLDSETDAVVLYHEGNPMGEVIRSDRSRELSRMLADRLCEVSSIPAALDVRHLIHGLRSNLSKEDTRISNEAVVLIGSIGDFTESDEQEYRQDTTLVVPSDLVSAIRRVKHNRIDVWYPSRPSPSDRALLKGLMRDGIDINKR